MIFDQSSRIPHSAMPLTSHGTFEQIPGLSRLESPNTEESGPSREVQVLSGLLLLHTERGGLWVGLLETTKKDSNDSDSFGHI